MVVDYLIGWRVRSELCPLNRHSRNESDKVSGAVPSVSEDHVRCDGGLGGACPGGTLRARLPIGCRFKKREEVTLRISTQDMNPVARYDLWFGDQAPSLGDHSGTGIAERRDLNGD